MEEREDDDDELDDVLETLPRTKGVGTRDFLQFIHHLLAHPLLSSPSSSQFYILLDNVAFHSSPSVLNRLNESPHLVHGSEIEGGC